MRYTPAIMLGIALAAGALAPADAEIRPSSDIVLPYFEVSLSPDATTARTTLFSINNSGEQPVEVLITVRTNWGAPVLDHSLTLGPNEVQTSNLRDWFVNGELPGGRRLTFEELAHVQAALTGLPSPRTQLYYATPVSPGVAVGSITFRTNRTPHSDEVWGDSFVIDPAESFTEGETLVNIDASVEPLPLCRRHAVRFINGGRFDAGTELMVWTKRVGRPLPAPNYPDARRIQVTAEFYAEDGRLLAEIHFALLPIERLKVSDLAISEPFGWIDLVTDVDAFVTAHYSAGENYSAALHAWCLPAKNRAAGPGIQVEKLTNGASAQLPPGPNVPVGNTVHWTYVVSNTGDAALSAVSVEDSDGVAVSCPATTLAVGESMICTAQAPAVACQHENTATATGTPPQGDPVTDTVTGHYYGEERGALGLQVLLNGDDADTAPGPTVITGRDLTWTYTVTNQGEFRLAGIVVADEHGTPIQCPASVLLPGGSMTCTAHGLATAGQHAFTGTVSGQPACGPSVNASDPTHYFSPAGPLPDSLTLKKYTNGEDADAAPGPTVLVGAAVTWTYTVTATGGLPLSGISVTDDRGVVVTCPKTVLSPGESMTCVGQGTAVRGQYANVGTAHGTPSGGGDVVATDPSHYLGVQPGLRIEKMVNGYEADTPAEAPVLIVGRDVLWTYQVTNVGDTALDTVAVTDDHGVAVTCPKTVLQPGESMTCTAGDTAVQGLYCNVGTVSAHAPAGPAVTASDTACYTGRRPRIAIEKRINGQDANAPPGPTVLKGSDVTWTYLVSNTGDVALSGIGVTDDRGVTVTCPKTALDPGETMSCTAEGKAVSGQYCNVGTVRGSVDGTNVDAFDAACYFGIWPDIQVEKMTNGEDADTPPGPTVNVGDTVTWTYAVTNAGDVALAHVTVTDSKGVAVTCPKTVLQAGESMVCTASGRAVEGQYSNIGTATGTPDGAGAVTASDPSHYKGTAICYQGCTPGYWKNHTGSWPATGYSTSQRVDSVFSEASHYPTLDHATLLQALSFGGGTGTTGAAEILLRAGVAALLNAAHPSLAYPRSVSDVITDVNWALASENRDTMLALASNLDADNNRGCPLN